MDLERGLEIQRVKLLRLLAGWVAVLGVLTFGPVALPVPRWVRAFFDRVLTRAELATQFLVRASALMSVTGDLVNSAPLKRAYGPQENGVPSAQALLRRMRALRDVLENLPRHARRLLRVQKIGGEAVDFSSPSRVAPAQDLLAEVGVDWVAPRVERPPDKSKKFLWLALRSRSDRTGGFGATDRGRALHLIA